MQYFTRDLRLKSLVVNGVAITTNGGDLTTASNIGGGAGAVFSGEVGNDLQFRTITVVSGAATAGAVANISVDTSGSTVRIIQHPPGGGGTSIHGDSLVEVPGGSKWISDIRVGDLVRGRNGVSEVLGIWRNLLAGRSLWSVNGVVCTPGHLFPTPRGWAAPSAEAYISRSYGKLRSVKGKNGMIDTQDMRSGPDAIIELALGMDIMASDGSWQKVTTLEEYTCDSDGELKRMVANGTMVYALLLDNSDLFFVDGYAVGTLA